MRRLLMAVGLPSESAAICAEVFLEADLKGHAIQGVDHIHSMLLSMRDGRSNPGGRPRIVYEKEASALVDGEGGPGQPALLFGADLAVKKTKKAGCCAVGVRNCYDVFMLGYYGERIAREGLVGIVMTTGTPPGSPLRRRGPPDRDESPCHRHSHSRERPCSAGLCHERPRLGHHRRGPGARGGAARGGWRSGRTACRPGIRPPPPRGRIRPWEATRAMAWACAWDFSQALWWGHRWAGPPSTQAMSPGAEKEDI